VTWRLRGYDTFSREYYPLEGKYADETEARDAARRRLVELEKEQPSKDSGGQDGIQDQVFIVQPDGSVYRFRG
jgi:hypothetical protein